jgi:ribonuclease Z
MRSIFEARLVNDEFHDPGVYVDFRSRRRALLFDLGDHAALAPRQLLRLSDAFVSHAHMDHFIGFDRLVRTCVGRHPGIRIAGPPGFVAQVERRLAAYTWDRVEHYDVEFVLTVTEIDEAGATCSARFRAGSGFAPEPLPQARVRDGVLLDEPGFRVRCALLDHRTPCLGFAVEEKDRIKVHAAQLAALGLAPGPRIAALKRRLLAGEEDPAPLAPAFERVRGKKIAYVTDVADHARNRERVARLAHGADVLFIESVFLDADAAHASRKQHLTARQAGEIARLAGARSVVPFHFSPRYVGREAELRAELDTAFRGADG